MRKARAARAVLLLAGLAAAMLATGCAKKKAAIKEITTEPVARQDIVVTVEATGTVEPINVVEVKSKASGQIVRMPVEIGSVVAKGELLVQIDTEDVQNAYNQTRAALLASEARGKVSASQRSRADELLAQKVITAQEHEAATLEDANAQAALVKARTDLELARQRLADATVRAPIAGTVLAKPVSVGQVISSATSSVSGGTALLSMADLKSVRIRALVSETDIGRVRPGQTATVTVDAYPQRPFEGTVEKVEPQAVVQQSVTMFPVLVSLSNEDGLLLPGMNGEVTMMIDRRDDVLAVPVDALRSSREVIAVASALSMNPDSVRAQIGRAREVLMASAGRGTGDSARAGAWRRGAGGQAGGDTSRATRGRGRRPGANGTGGFARGGAGSGAAGAAVTAAGGAASGIASGGMSRNGGQVAIVKTAKGLEPRLVRAGLSNYDYVQVLSGLEEGDQVVMLASVELQQQRAETQDRIRQRVGGVPGLQSNTGTRTGGAGGAAGGGGSRSGGSGGGR
jgi:HlyD family secretion protein